MVNKNYFKFAVLSFIFIFTLAGCGCKKDEEVKVEDTKKEEEKTYCLASL